MLKLPRKKKQPSTSAAAAAAKPKQARRIQSSSSDDDDYTPQASTSTLRPSLFNATTSNTADTATLTNNMVKYFLNFSASKYQIKRAEISKAINVTPKMFPEVLKDCAKILKDVYGMEVSDVSENKNSSAFIVHAANSYGVSALQYAPDQRHEITLLFIILSYIFMKNGDVQDMHLNQFLQQLNIDVQEPHKVFGEVGKLIKDKFPRQMYLKRSKVTIEGVNEAQIHLTWGVRAEKEFDKKEMLKAVAGIMNRSPVTFINQYHEATQGEAVDEPMVLD